VTLTEPSVRLTDPAQLLAGFLDTARDGVLRKLDGVPEAELRRSRLPSGWTALELLKHLTHMERRWLCWGFLAEPVEDPWGDSGGDPDGRWMLRDDETLDQLVEAFNDQCRRSRQVVAGADLTDRASVGGRFRTPEEAPTLGWILLHVLQEHERHLGHLDVVRELTDGVVGE
jgi:uncharacterized damage-inducible protein DinB